MRRADGKAVRVCGTVLEARFRAGDWLEIIVMDADRFDDTAIWFFWR